MTDIIEGLAEESIAGLFVKQQFENYVKSKLKRNQRQKKDGHLGTAKVISDHDFEDAKMCPNS